MKTNASIDACISAIYEGVTNDDSWFEMLRLLAHDTQSKSGFFCLERNYDNQILSYVQTGFDASAIADYAAHFVDKDVWTKRLYNLTPGYFHASQNVLKQKDFYRTEMFNDWAQLQDMHHATGVYITNVGDASMRLSLQRDSTAGEYTKSDLQKLNRYTAHLKRAISLRNTFSATSFLKRGVSAIVDNLSFAAFLLQDLDKVLYFNARAEALFARSQGFVNSMGTLKLDQSWAQAFFSSVHASLNFLESDPVEPKFVHLFRSPAARTSFEVSVSPIVVNDIQFCMGYSRNLVLVVVKEEAKASGPDQLVLINLFGLTPKEAHIASLLCRGIDIKRIAELSHTSILTVRTHLKAILRKTGTGNQQQLIAKILNGIAALTSSGR